MDILLLFIMCHFQGKFSAHYFLIFPLVSSSLSLALAASRLCHPIRMPHHSRVPHTHLCLRHQRRYVDVKSTPHHCTTKPAPIG